MGRRATLGGIVERGEIRWYQFSSPDKKRPVLILTRSNALKFLNEVTVAPITRTIRGIPTEVILCPEDGLLTRSAVNLDHIQTVSRDKLGAYLGRLSDEKMETVRGAILFAMGYDHC